MQDSKHIATLPREVIIYDGACGLCQRSVTRFKQLDVFQRFALVPFQEADAHLPPSIWNAQLHEAAKQAVHVVRRDGTILRGGRAVMYALERVGWAGGSLPRLLQHPPFINLVEYGYHLVARHRNFFSRFI